MTTLQIAWAKEHFLEHALRLITPVVTGDGEAPSLAQDVDSLAQDAIDLFATLLRCDEEHSLLAATSDDYPYQATEEELAVLFRRFLNMSKDLSALTRRLQSQGHDIESQAELEAVSAHAWRLVHDDQSFYETETYRSLAEQAYAEYQSGQVEEWPV